MKRIFEIQKKIGAIIKDSKNPHFKNTYFDINKLIEELKPLLIEQNLMVVQPLTHLEGKPAIQTIVYDSEGNALLDYTIPLPENSDPQKMGSAITYYRRYSLVSMFFLQAEDDDGNAASQPQQAQSRTAKANPTAKDRAKSITEGVANGDAQGAAYAMANGYSEAEINAVWALLDASTQDKLTAAWPK